MKKKMWIIIAAVAIVAVIAGAFWLNASNQASAAAGQFQTFKAERGTLTATIGATGTVRAHQTAILTWQTSGSVETVIVNVGDSVAAGDVLATLAQTSLPQSDILAQADLVTAQRNLDNLLDSNTQSAQAQVNLVQAEKNYDSAKATLDGLLAANRGGTSADIQNAQAKYTLAKESYDQARTAYDYVKDLPDDDSRKAQGYTNLYNAEQSLKSAQNNLNFFLLVPGSRDIDKARANLALTQAQLEDAQREWNRLKDGPTAADIEAARAKVAAIQATLNMARLTAPIAGTVSVVNVMPGDQVKAGANAFRLDNLSRLLVDVQVSEVDINRVKIGQPVVITFDAIFGQEYHGKVTQVAQVGDVTQGAVNFTVTVEISDADAQVKPGMTAAVIVVVNALQDVLLVPNRAVRLVDGQRVVYVLRNGQPQEVKISLGANSDTMSEVVGGDLKAGDLIILNPPATFLSPNGGGRGPFGGGMGGGD
ncbi:MAG: efflux RND transporter periplasmic adaptor subunit [Anaerolineales bacterium]|nr:efflux RND transporter periplasmic adaptor subunit [Anaerolineales bacterium]